MRVPVDISGERGEMLKKNIQEERKHRRKFLIELYVQVKGDLSAKKTIQEIASRVGCDEILAKKIAQHLSAAGYITEKALQLQITYQGIRKVEEALAGPDEW